MASSSAPLPQTSPPTQSATSSKPVRILACVLCQHRKIKCDRNFPCSNCTKSNITCTPSTPAPARKRRRPNQDLQERLARCEELLKEYATEKPEYHEARPSQASTSDGPYPKWQPAGKLIRDNGSMRFMDSPLLGVIYDELRAMREIVDDEESEDSSPWATIPDDNSDLLLSTDSPVTNVENLWPEAGHIFRLWQIYLDRVNPLTKIIHVPTLQPYVNEVAAGSHNIPKNIEALLFSIFLMAAVSLTPDECRSLLMLSREEALERYSSGVRTSLQQIGFLRSHDLTTLQALVIYLISLQGRYNRHAAWVLNGVAIRIGQKMGLHRDGETLGLSPFEAEMRSRLWWQMIMVDSRYAVFSGLSHSLLPRNSDTKPPKNVNDTDIFPSATEPFQDREGPTEMIFCLMMCKFAKFALDTPGFEAVVMLAEADAAADNKGPTKEQVAECRRGFGRLRDEFVEIMDNYCDPTAGPIHEMTITMRKYILDRLQELVSPSGELPEWRGEVKTAKDKTFKVAVEALEQNEVNYLSTKDRGFFWFFLLHFQLDIPIYVAGQLCHRTEGNLVERAWRQVDVVYSSHPELLDVTNKNYAMLAVFTLRAWKKREESVLGRTGLLPEVPFYIERLRVNMPNDDYKTGPTPPNPYSSANVGVGSPLSGMPDNSLDGFLGYFDPEAMEWDMFANSAMNADGGAMPGPGPYSMGPSADW